jgi:hypothetical protein
MTTPILPPIFLLDCKCPACESARKGNHWGIPLLTSEPCRCPKCLELRIQERADELSSLPTFSVSVLADALFTMPPFLSVSLAESWGV